MSFVVVGIEMRFIELKVRKRTLYSKFALQFELTRDHSYMDDHECTLVTQLSSGGVWVCHACCDEHMPFEAHINSLVFSLNSSYWAVVVAC